MQNKKDYCKTAKTAEIQNIKGIIIIIIVIIVTIIIIRVSVSFPVAVIKFFDLNNLRAKGLIVQSAVGPCREIKAA